MTVTLYSLIQNDLLKKGLNEFVDSQGNLVLYDSDFQFTTKLFNYDPDVQNTVDQLFNGLSLTAREHDEHFKKAFLFRFLNRNINRQTVEAFKFELAATFYANRTYINHLYENIEKMIASESDHHHQNNQRNETENTTTNKQDTTQQQLNETTGTSTTDNRNATATLPQNNVQLDVNNTVMVDANENTISRDKNVNNQDSINNTSGTTESDTESNGLTLTNGETTTTTKNYQLDVYLKTNGLLDTILNEFDKKCFMQIW